MAWNLIKKFRAMRKKHNNKTPVDEPRKKSPRPEQDSDDNLSTSCTATSASDRLPDRKSSRDRGKGRISPAIHVSNPAAVQRRQRKMSPDNQPENKAKEQFISTKKVGKRTPDKKRTRDIEEIAPDVVNDLTSKKTSTRKKNKKNIFEEQKMVTQQGFEDEGAKPKKQLSDTLAKKLAKKFGKKNTDQAPPVNNEVPLKMSPKNTLPANEVPLVNKPAGAKDEEKEDTTDLRSFKWLMSPPREKGNLNQNQNPAPNVSNPKNK